MWVDLSEFGLSMPFPYLGEIQDRLNSAASSPGVLTLHAVIFDQWEVKDDRELRR